VVVKIVNAFGNQGDRLVVLPPGVALSCFAETPGNRFSMPVHLHPFGDDTTWVSYLPPRPQKGAVSGEADMNPIPGNAQAVRDDSGVRRAAMLVIDELGESAAEYAVTRAMVLQRQGDEIGASTWRRVAPVIEE
jgi:hypothetical protein